MREWLKSFWTAFKNVAILFSFAVNFGLVLALLLVSEPGLNMAFDLKGRLIQPLLHKLDSAFLGLGEAEIDTTVEINEPIPIEFELPLDQQLPISFDLPLEIFADQAKRRVSLGLIIAEVIKSADIKLDDDRVRQKVEQFAQAYEQPQEVVDYYYSNKQQLAAVENVVLEDQVVDWVLEQAKVEDAESGFGEVMDPQAARTAE